MGNNIAEMGANNEEPTTVTSNNRNITILGDSTIKVMKAFKMKQGMSKNDKVYIKPFPVATVECMTDYMKHSMKFKPDYYTVWNK